MQKPLLLATPTLNLLVQRFHWVEMPWPELYLRVWHVRARRGCYGAPKFTPLGERKNLFDYGRLLGRSL